MHSFLYAKYINTSGTCEKQKVLVNKTTDKYIGEAK